MIKQPAVYMMASYYHGTIYLGVTSDLAKRVFQHKNSSFPGFSAKYNCKILVFYTFFQTMFEAIAMEKKLKKTSRIRKIALIECNNPEWKDLLQEKMLSV